MMDTIPSKKKILFLHHSTGIGGSPISLMNLIKSLNSDLFEVKVLFLKNSDVVDFFINNKINVRVLKSFFYNKLYLYFFHSEAGNLKLFDLRRIIKILYSYPLNAFYLAPKIIKQENCDLLYLNSSFLSDWAIAGRISNKKVICHIREPIAAGYLGIRRFFLRIILKICTTELIAISSDNSARLNLPNKTKVIYNSVNKEFLEKIINDSMHKSHFKVLYVGGLSCIKGFHILADSIHLIKSDIIIYLLGYYPSKEKTYETWKKKIKKMYGENKKLDIALKKIRAAQNVVEIGITENVYQYLIESSLLIFPSTMPHFARPIVEAMFFHLPVLASAVKGMDEIVIDGFNGKLVKPNDPIELATEINKFAAGYYDTKSMGDNGYNFAIKNFMPENNKLIEEVILDLFRN